MEQIKTELIEIRDKFGDDRKTKIVAAEGELDIEDLIKEEQAVIALTHFGYIKRMPIDTYRSQKRGGNRTSAAKGHSEGKLDCSASLAHLPRSQSVPCAQSPVRRMRRPAVVQSGQGGGRRSKHAQAQEKEYDCGCLTFRPQSGLIAGFLRGDAP